jgi:hypothetical protein
VSSAERSAEVCGSTQGTRPNDSKEIVELVGHFFGAVKISRFPLPEHRSSFHTYVEASAPNFATASQILEGWEESR